MTTGDVQAATDPAPPRLRMSYEAYLEWADEDVHAEWVDGEVIVHMPPFEAHQTLLNFLNRLLVEYVEFEQLGVVLTGPFEMRLLGQKSARQPDILVITTNSLSRLGRERLEGPADLVVEIMSAESASRDRREKHREYQNAGVREYWMIHSCPGREWADFYRLDKDKRYELYASEDDEWVDSQVLPGFRFRPAWLWPGSRPPVREAFYELLSAEQRARYRQLYFPGT